MSDDIKPSGNFIGKYMRDIVTSGTTSLVIILGGMFTGLIQVGPAQTSADADYIRSLGPRITELESEVATLRAENTRLKISEALWNAANDNDPQTVICDLMESLPGLNWVKFASRDAEGNVEFSVVCIDAEYRARFNIGPFEYVGETDYSYWPKEVADEFYMNDSRVYWSRSYLTTHESWYETDGTQTQGLLTKFYYKIRQSDDQPDLEFVIGHLPKGVPHDPEDNIDTPRVLPLPILRSANND